MDVPPADHLGDSKVPRAHFHLTDLYDLKKIKYTLDFGTDLSDKKLVRSQFIYTLGLKDQATVTQILERCKAEGQKRVYVDLGLHTKMMQVNEVWILKKQPDGKYAKDLAVKLPNAQSAYGTMPSRANVENVMDRLPGADPDLIKQATAKSWYLDPKHNSDFFPKSFGSLNHPEKLPNVSRDLQSLDCLQK